jgi:hypothetical protein
MRDEDVYWVNKNCVDALAFRKSEHLPKETLDKLFAWEEKIMRGRKGNWFAVFGELTDASDVSRLGVLADASGVCDATGLGAPRLCIRFVEDED